MWAARERPQEKMWTTGTTIDALSGSRGDDLVASQPVRQLVPGWPIKRRGNRPVCPVCRHCRSCRGSEPVDGADPDDGDAGLVGGSQVDLGTDAPVVITCRVVQDLPDQPAL